MEGNNLKSSDNDIAKARKKYIWLNGVLGWGLTTAILVSIFRSDDLDEYLPRFMFSVIIYATGGYFWGSIMWRIKGKHDYLDSITPKDTTPKRVPLPNAFHHFYLLFSPLLGCLFIWMDRELTHASMADYIIPAIVVFILMIIQLILDLNNFDEEYAIRTTRPSPGFTFKQTLRLKWPAIIIAILAIPLGFLKVLGLFFFCLIFSYSYQRRMYIRSHRELGG